MTDDHDYFQGFLVFYQENNYILLEKVAVLPLASGRGVGKVLIGFCENFARQRRLNAVQLRTN